MAIHYPLSDESMERINREFFTAYDTNHWLFKIKMFESLLESTEEFVEEFGDEELEDLPIDAFHRSIQSEIVFMFYHITESLFSLLAVCDSVLPWVEMKHIRVREIAEFCRETVVDKDWEDGVLERIFYPNIRAPDDVPHAKESSLEFIEDYLALMAERYLDNDIYNEYKHGFRLSTSKSRFQVAPEIEPGGQTLPPSVEREGPAHVYLEEEEIGREDSEVYNEIYRVTSGFDYELFLELCHMNFLLIEQIILIREERQGPKDSEVGGKIEVNSFHNVDVSDVFDPKPQKEWELRVQYPMGDNDVIIG